MLKRSAFIVLIIAFVTGAFLLVARGKRHPSTVDGLDDIREYACSRIVSLSPNITETLFALGLGERTVSVTRFCRYPPEAREIAKVGGYLDPNYEAIAALRPDMVFLLPEHEAARTYLDEFDIRHRTVNNKTVSQILDAIQTIGTTCGADGRAEELATSIRSRMNAVRERAHGFPRPRVLISIGRSFGGGALEEVYVAGKNTSYDELISIAGGENAYEGPAIDYPVLSAEGIIRLDPDIIVELATGIDDRGLDEAAVIEDWKGLPGLEAVKRGKVYVITGDYAVIPGPRFILFLEELQAILHPETAEGNT